MSKIQVFLVDDHKMIREGFKKYIEKSSEFDIVGEAQDGVDCLEQLKSLSPDVVVTDVNMPEMDGIELTTNLVNTYPEIKVIGLTMLDDHRHVKQLLSEGASGYLLKDCEEAELIGAIKTVYAGGTFYSPKVTSIIMDNIRKVKPRADKVVTEVKISKRETEVLHLILKEYSNQEIADTLFISLKTVDAHKRNLLDKTGSKNLAGLILYAIDAKLFDDI
ncbi:MAG: DNA-binding response regulator [Bacteroidetes bacterium MedPE-SWsnd-G2]|nr:MAG: DNA-binding response regulator [Bacteroidetes bacterium MedPE-SWsnd-G2]